LKFIAHLILRLFKENEINSWSATLLILATKQQMILHNFQQKFNRNS